MSSAALAAAPPQGATAVRRRGLIGPLAFSRATLLICLLLQRFAVPAGGALQISVATPLVMALGAWCLLGGSLVIDRRRAAWFAALVAVALMATSVMDALPLAIAPRSSMASLIYWLAITSFGVLRFRAPVPERDFWAMVVRCLAIVAFAGLVQFVAQIAHLSLFRFTGLVPGRLLIESQYNQIIPLGVGSLLKSNGFFLVEPSVFSQFMAVGVMVEALYLRRPSRLVLFFAALLCSASGTGWLVLAAFVLALAVGAGTRGMAGAVLLAGGLAGALAATSLVLPGIAGSLLSRTHELSEPGSSGYERFVTPVMALHSVLQVAPWTFFTGTGPGTSSELSVPYFYRLNTPIKILLEYGVFGLGSYLGLLVTGTRTRGQTILLAPLLVLLLLTGGYHQFSPILFPVLLLGGVALLQPATPRRTAPG